MDGKTNGFIKTLNNLKQLFKLLIVVSLMIEKIDLLLNNQLHHYKKLLNKYEI